MNRSVVKLFCETRGEINLRFG